MLTFLSPGLTFDPAAALTRQGIVGKDAKGSEAYRYAIAHGKRFRTCLCFCARDYNGNAGSFISGTQTDIVQRRLAFGRLSLY